MKSTGHQYAFIPIVLVSVIFMIFYIYNNSSNKEESKYQNGYFKPGTFQTTKLSNGHNKNDFITMQRYDIIVEKNTAGLNPLYVTIAIVVIFAWLLSISRVYRNNQKLNLAYANLKSLTNDLDVTLNKLKKTSADLVEAQKKAFISDMVMGLSHDLMNAFDPLLKSSSYIRDLSNSIGMLSKKNKLSKNQFDQYNNETYEIGKSIYSDLEQILEWIIGFRTISTHQIQGEQEYIKLKEYISLCVRMLEFKLKNKRIQYTINCQEDITIKTIPSFISQIFINIINNAIEHGFDGYDIPDKRIEIDIEHDDENLTIKCLNNGRPINQNDITRIFDDFFTTKSGIKGMGLSYVKRIIEQGLNGRIICESNEKEGVIFTITFPYRVE
jgi:signal transduction histidine kinase